jgi:hypothetical protein
VGLMDKSDQELFHALIAASQKLVTTSRLASATLSEEFESLVTGPADEVEAILQSCPSPQIVWDGEFREEDCKIDPFTPDVPDEYRKGRVDTGAIVTHRPTGVSAEVSATADFEENRRRAMRWVKRNVEQKQGLP